MNDFVDNHTIARALAHKFGDSISASHRRADLLLTILTEYLSDFKKHPQSIIDMGDAIIRTKDELSFLTGYSDKLIPEDLEFLKERELIDYEVAKRGLKLYVDADKIINFNQQVVEEWKRDRWFFFNERHSKREKEKANRNNNRYFKENLLTGCDKSCLRDITDLFGEVKAKFIYLFDHYYKTYTGQKYRWDITKLNTMSKVWAEGWAKPFSEYGLSRALKEALADQEKGYLEKKWVRYFDPNSNQRLEGVRFDGLL